jgi:dihydrodipicolinate synthase/N-acetylneuraminate lyase
MDQARARKRLQGNYVTVPTMFRDEDLELDLPAQRQAVRFLIDGGIKEGTGVLLAGGAAGDFMTMSLLERAKVAETVVDAANGEIGVVMGAQTTSTRELVELARTAEKVGAEFIQVSSPFYFHHTEEDFYEFVVAAAEAADVGIVLYNTFWTSAGVSTQLIDRLLEVPNFIALKWSVPAHSHLGFERLIEKYHERLHIIDNDSRFVSTHITGARGIELHTANYWPQFGVRLWQLLEGGEYAEAQREMNRVVSPFMVLWFEMMEFTAGDGYLDKLCMELVGVGSSRCRPPTRDVREKFRDQAREMLVRCGVPGVTG